MADHEGPAHDAGEGGSGSAGALGRRQFLTRAGVGAAAAWAAPTILSVSAASAATVPPVPPAFIASGGDGGARSFTTVDNGATWPVTASPIALGEMHSVAYTPAGGSRWIGVGRISDVNQIVFFTSTNDGVSWTVSPMQVTGRLLDVATDGAGNWVAVGDDNGPFPGAELIFFSTNNGSTWTPGTFPVITTSVNSLHGVATDGTTWVAAGQNDLNQAILTISTNGGATWSDPLVLASNASMFDVATDGAGTWMAVGTLGGVGNTAVAWRASGSITSVGNWTQINGLGTGFATGITSNHAGVFVAVGRRDDPTGGAFSYTFNPGATAGTFPALPFVQSMHSVATDRAGTWIAVGWDGGAGPMRTFTSTDNGLNWTVTSSPNPDGVLYGVAASVVA